MSVKLILFLIILSTSCISQNIISKKQENKLEECLINAGIGYDGKHVNLLSVLISIENVLIDEQMINENDSKSYLTLYRKIMKNEIDINYIFKRIETQVSNFYVITIPTNYYLIIVGCFNYVNPNETKKMKIIDKEQKILNKGFRTGMSVKIFKKALKTIRGDFKANVFRLPLLAVIYSQIEFKNLKL